MHNHFYKILSRPAHSRWWLAFVSVLLLASGSIAQQDEATSTLDRLYTERQLLTAELDQYRKNLDSLVPDGTSPEESANPAIRKLAQEAVVLKQKLVRITEQEVTLLQEQIISSAAAQAETPQENTVATAPELPPPGAIESKPLRSHSAGQYTLEEETVERLHKLLESYYAELQASARVLPTADEIARRELAKRDVETLSRIPYSVDKVRLNGAEGNTALAQITRRLMDATIPESRRDIAPICIIKTRLFDTLVGSESRSLRPVGKNHYIARVRLQPGDTTLIIMSMRWDINLPQHTSATDFVITFYRPSGGTSELHVFAVDDLLALDQPHIPAWLPEELQIKSHQG